MADSGGRPQGTASSAQRWGLRLAVLLAFAATVWWFGPRAAQVLAARFHAADRESPAVALDRVGFVAVPDWLRGQTLVAVARDIQPCLHGSQPILDDAAAARLQETLQRVAWVRQVKLERVFPDRFRVALVLRRPVLAVRGPDGGLLCHADRDGIALPAGGEEPGLPVTVLRSEGGAVPARWASGALFPDPRVAAAAAVAVEWRDQFAPLVPGCPDLLEVDANNLGERWTMGPRHPEIRVALRRVDGAPVVFAYDRPPDSQRPRVPIPVKAEVLRRILERHPGLTGLTGGDLRFQVRWQDWLQPRSGVDPAAPWAMGPGAAAAPPPGSAPVGSR